MYENVLGGMERLKINGVIPFVAFMLLAIGILTTPSDINDDLYIYNRWFDTFIDIRTIANCYYYFIIATATFPALLGSTIYDITSTIITALVIEVVTFWIFFFLDTEYLYNAIAASIFLLSIIYCSIKDKRKMKKHSTAEKLKVVNG